MIESLLGILKHGLSIWDSTEGKNLYNDYLSNKKAYDEDMDKRANGLKYSQLKCDRSLRNIANIAEAYYRYIRSK